MSGWLDDVLGAYLDRVSEREFDAAFLALLRAAGYTHVHLIHGVFEFGKDFIARRDGLQFGLQTKAGDINLAAWRGIRPQIEEILWNDIAHPDFDKEAPRRAVLVTTGRLVGGAAADAQQYGETLVKRMPSTTEPPFEVWDRESLLALMEMSPAITLNGWGETPLLELLGLLADTSRRQLTSRSVERSTRQWVGEDLNRATLATALVGNRLLETARPDLAMTAAAGLLRAGAVNLHVGDSIDAWTALDAGRRLFEVYATSLVDGLASVADDPRELIRVGDEILSGVSYPVRCSRFIESLGLLGLLRFEEADDEAASALVARLERFVTTQPGAGHPISDAWAASLVPAATLLRRADSPALVPWLETTVAWICDHYFKAPGLANVYAEAADEVRYLIGEAFEHIDVPRRRSSYLATTVLDLASALELPELFRDAFNDFSAVDLAFPALEPQDEAGQYLFDGPGLTSEANVTFDEGHDFAASWKSAVHHRRAPASYLLQRAGRSWDLLAVASALRDRHFLSAIRELAGLRGARGAT
jgi:hypothetical protein